MIYSLRHPSRPKKNNLLTTNYWSRVYSIVVTKQNDAKPQRLMNSTGSTYPIMTSL